MEDVVDDNFAKTVIISRLSNNSQNLMITRDSFELKRVCILSGEYAKKLKKCKQITMCSAVLMDSWYHSLFYNKR